MSKTKSNDQVCAFSRVLRLVGMGFMRAASTKSSAHNRYSKQESMVLGLIAMNGPCRMGDIAAMLGVGQSAVTPMIDRMEEMNVVERKRSADDRRVWHVALTKDGKTAAEEEEAVFQDVATQMLAALDDEEREQLIDLLARAGSALTD